MGERAVAANDLRAVFLGWHLPPECVTQRNCNTPRMIWQPLTLLSKILRAFPPVSFPPPSLWPKSWRGRPDKEEGGVTSRWEPLATPGSLWSWGRGKTRALSFGGRIIPIMTQMSFGGRVIPIMTQMRSACFAAGSGHIALPMWIHSTPKSR